MPEGGIQSGCVRDTDGDLAYRYTRKDGTSTLQHFNGDAWSASSVDREFFDVRGVSEDRAPLIVNQYRYDGAPSPVPLVRYPHGGPAERVIGGSSIVGPVIWRVGARRFCRPATVVHWAISGCFRSRINGSSSRCPKTLPRPLGRYYAPT